ncbi:DNA polymerase III subunit delta' [Sneathiella limimaris]|uniref:DNA polymerase III subunit delta' n=1 Tax=Sneathiella limimaris TaxID=1964213 RepID=UPI00146CD49C|nr:DNA polymerase III subunit delta' [Sneathiella limimaris]
MSDLIDIDRLPGLDHPRDCQSLIGHERAEQEFLDSFNGGRFHHAWLISGIRGVGKASLAYRIAKFLLSQEGSGGGLFGPPDSLDVSDGHPAISRIKAEAHPGLTVLKRRYDDKGKKYFKNIRIDDVRGLTSFFGMTASDGGWRVVIVDAADDMNVNAANALLKILEEPPAKTVFLLLSHSPAALLPTIKSRCRRLILNPLSQNDVMSVLSRLDNSIQPTDLEVLALLGEGSPGKAAALHAEGGVPAFQALMSLFAEYPGYDPEQLHGLADQAGRKDGEGLYRVLCELIPWWLSRFVRAASSGFVDTRLLQGEMEIMEHLSSRQPLSFWIEMWEKANTIIERADTVNLDRKQVILNLFLSPTIKT